jgi:ABC-2 type transport system permease protein
MTLAGSVVEEKSSRLVEIIAARIPVRQLLAGKVLGHTTLALGQMALYMAVGLVGLSFSPYSSFLPSISSGVGWFLAFFLVGFLLLACLWAVAGALASRTEDLQSTAMPLSFLLMGVWFSAFLAKGTALVVLSFVPPFSAVLMTMRLLQGGVPLWQPIVALAILVVAAGGVILVAERLYRRSLLQTQGRVSLKAAWRAAD